MLHNQMFLNNRTGDCGAFFKPNFSLAPGFFDLGISSIYYYNQLLSSSTYCVVSGECMTQLCILEEEVGAHKQLLKWDAISFLEATLSCKTHVWINSDSWLLWIHSLPSCLEFWILAHFYLTQPRILSGSNKIRALQDRKKLKELINKYQSILLQQTICKKKMETVMCTFSRKNTQNTENQEQTYLVYGQKKMNGHWRHRRTIKIILAAD